MLLSSEPDMIHSPPSHRTQYRRTARLTNIIHKKEVICNNKIYELILMNENGLCRYALQGGGTSPVLTEGAAVFTLRLTGATVLFIFPH